MAKALSRTQPQIDPFAARLRQLRVARGLTQQELGRKVGLSQRMMAYYETQGGTPSAPLVARFAKALGSSVDHLLGARSGHLPANDAPVSAAELRLWRRLRIVEKLSPADRRAVIKHAEGLARQAGVPLDPDDTSD